MMTITNVDPVASVRILYSSIQLVGINKKSAKPVPIALALLATTALPPASVIFDLFIRSLRLNRTYAKCTIVGVSAASILQMKSMRLRRLIGKQNGERFDAISATLLKCAAKNVCKLTMIPHAHLQFPVTTRSIKSKASESHSLIGHIKSAIPVRSPCHSPLSHPLS
jgi:hypothetical protein